MTKYGLILKIPLDGLRGKTVHHLCELLRWNLPDAASIAEAKVENGSLWLKFREDEPIMPEVPEGAPYPILDLFRHSKTKDTILERLHAVADSYTLATGPLFASSSEA